MTRSSQALYSRRSRREQRKSAPLSDDRDEFAEVLTGLERNPNEHPEQAFRRGLQQGAAEIFHALQKAQLLDERTLKKLSNFAYGELWRFRHAKRRQLCRHIGRDRPPRLKINPQRR